MGSTAPEFLSLPVDGRWVDKEGVDFGYIEFHLLYDELLDIDFCRIGTAAKSGFSEALAFTFLSNSFGLSVGAGESVFFLLCSSFKLCFFIYPFLMFCLSSFLLPFSPSNASNLCFSSRT